MLKADLPAVGSRRRAAILAEEAVEVGGIAKPQSIADLLDRQIELLQARTSFAHETFVDQRTWPASLLALAMGMQLVGRHTKHRGVARYRPTVAIVQLDHLQEIADERGATATRGSLPPFVMRAAQSPQLQAQQQQM